MCCALPGNNYNDDIILGVIHYNYINLDLHSIELRQKQTKMLCAGLQQSEQTGFKTG